MDNFIYNPPKDPFLDILYHDDFIMVVNKPSGLLSVPGRLECHYDSVISRIRTLHRDCAAVHRLDMDTSGLMVVALNKEATSNLCRQFEAKTVLKLYYALVEGLIDERGDVTLPIRCDLERRPLQIVDFEQGKPSHTIYRRVDDFSINEQIVCTKNCSLVELTPITGRSHQLRVHLNEISHPILGDRFYGKTNTDKASRLCLHAFSLEFSHPHTCERLEFKSFPDFLCRE